jgi:hypothetical protein
MVGSCGSPLVLEEEVARPAVVVAVRLDASTDTRLSAEISVSKTPGSMQAIRMPNGLGSHAKLSLSAPRACLLAA